MTTSLTCLGALGNLPAEAAGAKALASGPHITTCWADLKGVWVRLLLADLPALLWPC